MWTGPHIAFHKLADPLPKPAQPKNADLLCGFAPCGSALFVKYWFLAQRFGMYVQVIVVGDKLISYDAGVIPMRMYIELGIT